MDRDIWCFCMASVPITWLVIYISSSVQSILSATPFWIISGS